VIVTKTVGSRRLGLLRFPRNEAAPEPAASADVTETAGIEIEGQHWIVESMPIGKIKMFNEDKGYGFIQPDGGTGDVFFHVTVLREGDEITVGKAVTFEIGVDPKSGKSKAVSVDLA
jgi:CspA family cold shock protein